MNNTDKHIQLNLAEQSGISCFFSSLKVLSDYFGRNVPEYFIYFMAGGLDVVYSPALKENSKDNENLGLIFPDMKQSLKMFSEQMAIMIKSLDQQVLNWPIHEILNDGKLILLIISPNILPFMKRKFDHIITTEQHAVLVSGWNETKKIIEVFDPYIVTNGGRIEIGQGTLPILDIQDSLFQAFTISNEIENKILDKEVLLEQSIKKIHKFIESSDNTGKNSGLSACKKMLNEQFNYNADKKSYVRLAFIIKTNWLATLDYITAMVNDQKEASLLIQDEISLLKISWDKAYMRLIRFGYNIHKNDGQPIIKEVENLLDQQVCFFKLLCDQIIRR